MNSKDYLEYLIHSYSEECESLEESLKKMQYWNEGRSGQFGIEWPPSEVIESLNLKSTHIEMVNKYLENWVITPFFDSLPDDVKLAVKNVPIGILPIRVVNAHTLKAPSGEPLIIMNHGVLMMVSHYFEVLFSMKQIVEESDFLSAHEYLNANYRFIVQYFDKNGEMDFPQKFVKISIKDLSKALMMTLAVENFIIAHEIAHVYAGHLECGMIKKISTTHQDKTELNCYQLSWAQEFEADEYGWIWYQKSWKENDLLRDLPEEIGFSAPFYIFIIMSLIEKNLEISESTHPPSVLRIKKMIAKFCKDPKKQKIAFDLLEIAETVPKINVINC
jgi:hypothetical protein